MNSEFKIKNLECEKTPPFRILNCIFCALIWSAKILRMAPGTFELNPVSRITADAVGEPGQRTFFLQARKGPMLVTVLCEKEQIRALGVALEEMILDLKKKYPKGSRFMQLQMDMSLEEPVSPDFRVGQLGLGYDEDRDLIILIARELAAEDVERDESDERVLRLFASRAQMDALSRQAADVVSRGRPVCPLCGKPMDAEGNCGFCPRRNGHSDEIVFA